MERQIPLLPVPPSTARDELIARVLGLPPAGAVRPTLPLSALAQGPKERGLRKLSVALALAASLLVFALVWWSWPRDSVAPPNRAPVARGERDQNKLDERLSGALVAGTPKERLLKLADLADEVHDEASRMTNNAERLDQWARFYSRVVSEHLLAQARQLPPEDRPVVLTDIANRLRDTESKASRLASGLEATSPRSASSLNQIALVARRGDQDLRALMRT
jgi:hypothetical protein